MFSQEGKQLPFEKGTRKGKGRITYNPDRTDSMKEKQARCFEIASVLQEHFALRDEKERDYAKFKSLVAGFSVNGDKKKLAIISSGSGTVQYQTSELSVLYHNMNAGQT